MKQAMRAGCCGLREGVVSVVLPVYNQAGLLPEAVAGVLAQTYKDWELILVDDGSTDGVQPLLDEYSRHPQVRCFSQSNQGLPKALSNGFELARGEFWTWTSADNIMLPRMLERLVAKLQTEPALGMVYADYYAIDDRGELLRSPAWRPQNRPNPGSGEIRLPRSAKALNTVLDNFIGPCFMYRGWLGRLLGDYAPQTGIEDYDYWMRINAFFPAGHLGDDELLYRYRVHDNTISARAAEHRILQKAHQLLRREKKRGAYFRSKALIAADRSARKRLSRGRMPRVKWLEIDHPNLLDLLALDSREAAARADELGAFLNERDTPLALLFAGNAAVCPRLLRLLRRDGCIALTDNPRAAARIRMSADCPVLDLKAAQAPAAALAFARNRRAFRETWDAGQLARRAPSLRAPAAGRHILLQLDSFTQGGMENVAIDLAHALRAAGFKATIANLGKSGEALERARAEGIRVESFDSELKEADYIQWLKQNDVALVNAHYSLFAAAACRQANIPFIQTIHNSYVWLAPEAARAYRRADAATSAYVCVSATAAHYADAALGLDVAKMRVAPNGIDASRMLEPSFHECRRAMRDAWGLATDAAAEAPVFLNVASIMGTKAQLTLVKAFAAAAQRLPKARLVLLGGVMEPPYMQEVEAAARALGIGERVIFAGFQRDAAPYYHGADVFVLPSHWEGWSLSLGEAMAAGLSCVATDVGSAYEFAGHPRVELLAPPAGDITKLNCRNIAPVVYGDHPAFTAALAEAMLRAAARERAPVDAELAERLDRRHAYSKYAEIFQEFLPPP